MGKLLKKNERGAAANYITRTRAVRKLQLSLADFRRLCILKGVYPREPRNKKKAAGKSRNPNNTFYYIKDINYLMHEPIVQKIREHKVFLKKLARALTKGQLSTAKTIEENEPKLTLDHLVKERYPTFIDAVRDLDDCLCHVFLFATLPSTDKIEKRLIDESQRLAAEFQNYVINSRCLQKVFLSIKGIYYQAEIKGQSVTWMVPYQFSQEIPTDVDFRVMLTFLEFYHTLLSFVNFKLYSDLNLKYPPRLDAKLDDNGAGLIASYIVESKDSGSEIILPPTSSTNANSTTVDKKQLSAQLQSLPAKIAAISDQVDNIPEEMDVDNGTEESEAIAADFASAPQQDGYRKNLFSNMTVFLSREVPRYALEFVLRVFGATVCWPETSGDSSPFKEDSDKITHQIVDRPLEHLKLRSDRVYLQPQWVFDCVNAGQLLKEDSYGPGKTLPPHLSPFVEYSENEYNPAVENVEGEVEDEELLGSDNEVLDDGDILADEADAIDNQQELEAEATGLSYNATEKPSKIPRKVVAEKKKQQIAVKQEAERVEMAKMVMSNKQRRQIERVQREQATKSAETKRLQSNKRKLK